ncbi:MAG TPA: methyltransferase domain-containing protein [Actinomycetota bacterium]|nr:methyltransferase domain-containing protein [Actinomycetota bacterium]
MDPRGVPISSSSQPSIMATMLDELRLAPGLNVLEVGAGTGYNAALISKIVGPKGRVTTVDLDPDIVKRAKGALSRNGTTAKVVLGDGREGWLERSPFDRIIVTASSFGVPRAWIEQLSEGGLLTLPMRLSDRVFWPQVVVTFVREGDQLRSVSAVPGGFMALRASTESSVSESHVYVGAFTKGKQRSFGSLVGPSLERLSSEALKALIRNLSAESTHLAFPEPQRRYDLEIFLALAAEPSELVSASGTGAGGTPGLIGDDGSWVLTLAGKGKWCRGVDISGACSSGENRWVQLSKEWERLGRPSSNRLRISLQPRRPRNAWKMQKAGEYWIDFGWAK